MTTTDTQFAADVLTGLSAHPKHLSSKYFYDETGDRLFQAIMKLPEYYLTDSEYEIFSLQKQKMLELFSSTGQPFDLIEFGAGDGFKTKVLLEHLVAQKADFRYVPIDISSHVLSVLEGNMCAAIPSLDIRPVCNDYFSALSELQTDTSRRKVILFLGSNVGNFSMTQAEHFFREMADRLNPDDLVVTGFDLKKDPALILAAYNDSAGVTKAFNLNLLQRINNELDADFDLSLFTHYPTYDPLTGETRSFLISQREQTVSIGALERSFHFGRFEPVFMEVSRKYDLSEIAELAQRTGFRQTENLFDCKHWYTDAVWHR